MESIASVLFTLYRNTPRHGEWVVACLEGAWQAILGERLAAACRPVRFEDSCLTVEILDPSWREAISGMNEEISAKICTATHGEVRQLRLSP